MIDTLPGHSFFRPRKSFVDYVRKTSWLRYRRVIDCGAGQGLAASMLIRAKFKVAAIDLMKRPVTFTDVHLHDALKWPFDETQVALVARPCLGAWVAKLFKRAIVYGAPVLYVGVPRNDSLYLRGLYYETLLEDCGEDGENLYHIFGDHEDTEEWNEIKPYFWKEKAWMRPMGNRYCNAVGGGFDKSDVKDDERFRIMRVRDESQLPDVGRRLRQDKLDSGWVAPDGAWFGCQTSDHDALARYEFRMSVKSLEVLGFVRAYGQFPTRMGDEGGDKLFTKLSVEQRLTSAQKKTLNKKGYVTDDYDVEPSSRSY